MSQSTPVHARHARRMTSACIVAVAASVLLDGFAPPPLRAWPVHWLDLAALACLAWGIDWRALAAGEDRATPIDGLLLGALAIGAVQAMAAPARDDAAAWLAQALSGSAVYIGLTRALRRSPEAVETVWRALAAVAAVLGAGAVWAATGGLSAVRRVDALVDARWSGEHVLAKLLLFLALALSGRATERDAAPAWRLATLLAVIGATIHAGAGGLGLDPSSLARLDDPWFFSTLSVMLLLIVAVAREAWKLGRVRPLERLRWRALATATGGLAVCGALGEATGGEAVRILAGVAAALVMTVRTMPARALGAELPQPGPARALPLAPAIVAAASPANALPAAELVPEEQEQPRVA